MKFVEQGRSYSSIESCQVEIVQQPGWNGPYTVKYDGKYFSLHGTVEGFNPYSDDVTYFDAVLHPTALEARKAKEWTLIEEGDLLLLKVDF